MVCLTLYYFLGTPSVEKIKYYDFQCAEKYLW